MQRARFLTGLYIHHCILFIYWSMLSITIKSGILCAKSKFPGRTVHFLFHTAHSNVMVLLRYQLYGYTGCRKHINPDFVFTRKADLVNCSQKNTIFLKSLDTH